MQNLKKVYKKSRTPLRVQLLICLLYCYDLKYNQIVFVASTSVVSTSVTSEASVTSAILSIR